jgi:hypothetical protein
LPEDIDFDSSLFLGSIFTGSLLIWGADDETYVAKPGWICAVAWTHLASSLFEISWW